MSRLKTQKMGRSFSDQESATTPTEPLVKETIMTQTTPHHFNAPAGFREITEEGSWCGEFHGPEEWTGNITVTSRWNALNREIEFDIYSTVDGHANFDRKELEEIPGMIKSVLESIDLAEAKAFFERFPEPFEGIPTVNDLFCLARDNNLSAPQMFQAYVEHTEGNAK